MTVYTEVVFYIGYLAFVEGKVNLNQRIQC